MQKARFARGLHPEHVAKTGDARKLGPPRCLPSWQILGLEQWGERGPSRKAATGPIKSWATAFSRSATLAGFGLDEDSLLDLIEIEKACRTEMVNDVCDDDFLDAQLSCETAGLADDCFDPFDDLTAE